MNDVSSLLQTLAVYALPVLFGITLHEAAHAHVARVCGDSTAWRLGRVTWNPLVHVDLVGTVILPALLYMVTAGAFVFGYAKPVPVHFDKLRRPKRDMVWVALAGPAANFAQAWAWGLALFAMQAMGVTEPFLLRMGQAGVLVNVVLFAFNLFPLPPLDGGRILVGVLPNAAARWVARLEPWGFFLVMALVIMNVLGTIWMRPVMSLTMGALEGLLQPIAYLLR